MNLCTACGLDFTGTRDFDSHRIGGFPQTGPSEYVDRMRAGLVDALVPYNVSFGRRCLDEFELSDKGWSRDRFGRWSHPRRRAQSAVTVPPRGPRR